jgi:hypothetical protein
MISIVEKYLHNLNIGEKFHKVQILESKTIPRGDFHLPLAKSFLIPLQTSTTSSMGKAFKVTIFDMKITHRHLLWYALFQKIDAIEWMILLRNLEFSQNHRKNISMQTLILFDILFRSSNTRERFDHWNSQTKSIFRQLEKIFPFDDTRFLKISNRIHPSILDIYMEYCNIPQKAMSKNNLYNCSKIDLPRIHFPEEQYVGVGYKDKGNLPQGDKLPVVEFWTPEPEIENFSSYKKKLEDILYKN